MCMVASDLSIKLCVTDGQIFGFILVIIAATVFMLGRVITSVLQRTAQSYSYRPIHRKKFSANKTELWKKNIFTKLLK